MKLVTLVKLGDSSTLLALVKREQVIQNKWERGGGGRGGGAASELKFKHATQH